jgi:predicted RNase H-like nuclease
MKFIGIDLGWRSQPSGLCCLEWRDRKLKLLSLERLRTIDEIWRWCDRWIQSNEPAIVAVDAPTIIPNSTGMRLPDKLAHQYFGKYHAGCYPANLSLPFATRTVEFGRTLEMRGFQHAPTIEPKIPGRYQIEVFPHPATIYLFGLERILKYKKGRVAERRVELDKLYRYIISILPNLEPALGMSDDLILDIPSNGAALKATEDRLDSLLCAYVASHWWYWGKQRNLVLGDRQQGYIVVPWQPNGFAQN